MRLLRLNRAARSGLTDPDAAVGTLCSELWPQMVVNGSFDACMRVLDTGSSEAGAFWWTEQQTHRSIGYDYKAARIGIELLLWVLRDVLGMTGTKFGCGMALCGACTVHLDGSAVRSCITTIDSVGESKITTIEAIGATAVGAKIQKAWLEHEVAQCGYCQSGQIMTAAAFLKNTPNPTDAQIVQAMDNNLCRCGTYLRIFEAVKLAAANGQKS
jgi:isoquinoline 1-oxidoreductase alpha subunit